MRQSALTFGISAFVLLQVLDAQTPATAQRRVAAAQPAAAKLPVRRVVLYKNGVGYFEHVGRVRGTQSVAIDFTSARRRIASRRCGANRPTSPIGSVARTATLHA